MTQITLEQAIEIALAHHQAGRLADAEGIYRQILAQVPQHADALHLLGVVAYQTGHAEAALDLIDRAITANPAVADYHNNRANALKSLGRLGEAIDAYRRAVALKPDFADACNNLGSALREHGRLDEAIAAYQRAVRLSPGYAVAHGNLGSALGEQGRLDEAIAAFRRAIALEPGLATAQINLGTALKDQGRLDEAVDAYRRAIQLDARSAVAHSNLGSALWGRGRLEEAIEAYERAIQLRPGYAEAHLNLGNALCEQGRLDEAVEACRRAIALRPDFADAYLSLGNALREQGRLFEAIAAFRRTIALKPDFAEAHTNLGNALWEQGQLDEPVEAYRRAIALKPDLAEAHDSLGNALKDQGRLDGAIASFRTAVALKPDFVRAASNLVHILHYHPDHESTFILAEHRRWADEYAAPLAAEIRPHPNDRTPDRRLRAGYVSPDFRSHPVGRALVPLFSHRDRGQVEIVCYSDVRVGDAVTERLKALADRWQSVAGLSDAQLADLIRADGIDILVDPTLHTAGNRLLVFARKPAPVQVTLLGPPATTGLATMDYRLTDRYLDPPGAGDADYTEQSIRLPHCFWIYPTPEESPAVGTLPALNRGFLTFGCLNQLFKVSHPALELWAQVLQALPAARLVLLSQPGSHRDAACSVFRAAGIADERVEFVAREGQRAYLERYQQLDLSLDPFPYNGHTSTLDSLWMGVPVITLAGRTAVGRGGTSILSNLGLPELIARTPEEYVAIAVEWARNLERLAALRAGLRERMAASPLMDGKQYAADVEAAFRGMWTRWCRA